MMTCTVCFERMVDVDFRQHACSPRDATRYTSNATVAILPADPAARKNIPLATGLLDYFPDALVAVAELSRIGNEQHNPGEPLHWARDKSMDQADAIMRHMVQRGLIDNDKVRHSTKVAWRALAQLQLELEGDR